ncbi:hypothetical protein C8035_v009347 [Colletotrichum spinosum]|uniref:Uncharacterized protein n=1 Tax=Colletotrichum spinosum TaxID=1347390 RepID=A0A4V3HSH8_9PEZI|nr:hypothetical protein C8035_v009347 [Colletotrichum spinosum]
MSVLENLPSELLHLILARFSTLDPPSTPYQPYWSPSLKDAKAMLALMRTCRHLHDSIKPFLYKHIRLEFAKTPSLISLLRQLHSDPASAAAVNTLSLRLNGKNGRITAPEDETPEDDTAVRVRPKDEETLVLPQQDNDFLFNVAKKYGLQGEPLHRDLVVGLIILHTQSVRIVSVSGCPSMKLSDALHESLSRIASFPRLERLRFDMTSSRDRKYFADTLWFSHLAAGVTDLAITGGRRLQNAPFNWAAITRLSLKRCKITNKEMSEILQACVNLQGMVLERATAGSPHEHAMELLVRHKSTLRSLKYKESRWGHLPSYASALRAFTDMTWLSVHAKCLDGLEDATTWALPPTLEVLHMSFARERPLGYLDWLAAKKSSGELPNLREVFLEESQCLHEHAPVRDVLREAERGVVSRTPLPRWLSCPDETDPSSALADAGISCRYVIGDMGIFFGSWAVMAGRAGTYVYF